MLFFPLLPSFFEICSPRQYLHLTDQEYGVQRTQVTVQGYTANIHHLGVGTQCGLRNLSPQPPFYSTSLVIPWGGPPKLSEYPSRLSIGTAQPQACTVNSVVCLHLCGWAPRTSGYQICSLEICWSSCHGQLPGPLTLALPKLSGNLLCLLHSTPGYHPPGLPSDLPTL